MTRVEAHASHHVVVGREGEQVAALPYVPHANLRVEDINYSLKLNKENKYNNIVF